MLDLLRAHLARHVAVRVDAVDLSVNPVRVPFGMNPDRLCQDLHAPGDTDGDRVGEKHISKVIPELGAHTGGAKTPQHIRDGEGPNASIGLAKRDEGGDREPRDQVGQPPVGHAVDHIGQTIKGRLVRKEQL
jgi:hypothetical protein